MDPEAKYSNTNRTIKLPISNNKSCASVHYNENGCAVVSGIFTPDECINIIKQIDNMKLDQHTRNRERGYLNDKCLSKFAEECLMDFYPRNIKDIHGCEWEFKNINEHWRVIRGNTDYDLPLHYDAHHIQDINTCSKMTCMIYLNDPSGGELVFPKLNLKVEPSAGKAVLFDLKHQHYAKSVDSLNGPKYMLRSELFYKRKVKITDPQKINDFNEAYVDIQKDIDNTHNIDDPELEDYILFGIET